MLAGAILFLASLAGSANPPLHGADRLNAGSTALDPSPWTLDVGLHSTLLGVDGTTQARQHWLAQAATHPTPAATPAATTPTVPPTAPTVQHTATAAASPLQPATPHPTTTTAPGASSGGGGDEACDIDCETAHESDRQARYVLHRRSSMLRTHEAFAIATWGALVLTEALGTVMAINQPTWFGPGACQSTANPTRVLGSDFGCNIGAIDGVHETLAFATTGLYLTTAILGIGAPDPDNESVGNDLHARTLRLHKAMAWVHGIGMAVMPVLGILSAYPDVLLNPHSPTFGDDYTNLQKDFRSIHLLVGYATLAALTFAGLLELL